MRRDRRYFSRHLFPSKLSDLRGDFDAPRRGVLATLLRAAQPGSITAVFHKDGELASAGILGRLGDLGSVPAELSVAASTASGALDYVVVKDSRGAEKCVGYLKKHNAGRAKFLILSELEWAFHLHPQ